MRYKSFRIQNFKGIKDATVVLDNVAGARVFAFVGLNESGKTTILEAIHSFSPDEATNELVGGGRKLGVPIRDRVPRHLISTFSGEISVTAVVVAQQEQIDWSVQELKRVHDIEVDPSEIPLEFAFRRFSKFKDGDLLGTYFDIDLSIKVRTGRQRNWRTPSRQERDAIRDLLYAHTPDIAYFPTFVFNFPQRIFLTERGTTVDRFYRSVFQDILDYDGQGHEIEKDIVRRVRAQNLTVPWVSFLPLWSTHDDKRKIQHVADRAGAAVTRLVFGRWNQIFGEDTRGKEIVISYDAVEGEVVDDAGNRTKTDSHDVFVQFQIRDGTRRFNVNDRSLGFRWFFAFMLFTQFRAARSGTRPLLFLFDEPASNLHAAAQQKLLDSFPAIVGSGHTLAYSTHSHYMIEPKWLEQTFIVTNRADAPIGSVVEDISLDDESLDIKATPYRAFVNKHPSQTSYFQPILDRLEVVPSRFDVQKASVVVEGKSDYYLLRYAAKMLKRSECPILPATGAGTFGALASLSIGWGLRFLFVVDADSQGKAERDRYVREFGLDRERVVTLAELEPGISTIESVLDAVAIKAISAALGLTKDPTKAQVHRFFQERLACDRIEELSPDFRKKVTALYDALVARLRT